MGAFDRLLHRWVDIEPSTNRRALAQRALDAIGGIDLNPFAANIARFRLLLAALRAGGDTRLADAPAYHLNVAVGDSLVHGDPPGALPGMHIPGEEEALLANHGYAAEDHAATRGLLSRAWSAVVGNPPYIVVKDPALNVAYRQRFKTCHRQYSLAVPFTERFWQLARQETDVTRAGYIGMITSNSFMKREFGRKLVEGWVGSHDITHVVDTSNAYIPGHGTPTVILFGRSRAPISPTTRAVLGIRGEPSRPEIAERGAVWSSIVNLIDDPGSESEYVSVVDLSRVRLQSHPWSIGGGGASDLKDRLDNAGRRVLESVLADLGARTLTRADDVFESPTGRLYGVDPTYRRKFIVGQNVRDWHCDAEGGILFPYDARLRASIDQAGERRLWPHRPTLRQRVAFGKSQIERGLEWFEYSMLFPNRFVPAIAFSDVSTHNHFALIDADSPSNSHAPVIVLNADITLPEALGVLGVLNSSLACFWIKQVMQYKGAGGKGESVEAHKFQESWELDGTKLKRLPLPSVLPIHTASNMNGLASEIQAQRPEQIVSQFVPERGILDAAQSNVSRLLGAMIGSQEQLDWECYALYGLVGDGLTTKDETEPPLKLGERAFEILLARRIASGADESSWFDRHGSAPITELPPHWPAAYRAVVERRIDLIESDLNIGLIERPEHKRRWASKRWEEQVAAALRGWLLDRLEDRRYWPDAAAITTVARLTAEARADDDFVQVARLYAGREDVDLASLIGELVKRESVAYLAALRYEEAGLRKHADWLKTWELQRREDSGEDVGTIPAPPKYARPDFTGAGWEHRGKLDVPKERFISYPGAERETDASMVVGWAGWSHLERTRALAAWYLQAKRDGRDREHLKPLLAGLAELLPWLKQWFDDPNSDPSLDRPGSQIAALITTELRSLALTEDDLVAWRPTATARRGRPRKVAT